MSETTEETHEQGAEVDTEETTAEHQLTTEDEDVRGTLFIMFVFLLFTIGVWGWMYILLITRA
ncbi:MAG TPA: hypothetical protein ENI86_06285 [Acidimicrobiales bacterium]|nr:hypothetical protein [Acidimicrobiales bacterium]